jgi:hypothetical protein
MLHQSSFKRIHYALLPLLATLVPVLVHAQAGFLGFGESYQYDDGLNPSVAANNGNVVEVHNGTASAGPLWYKVGHLSGSALTWGSSYEYDSYGFNPSVAMDATAEANTTVVEVHNGSNGSGPMWYRVGEVVGPTVVWGSSHEYDTGYNPSVAMSGSIVVEVHNGSTSGGGLWYHIGKVNGTLITWGPSYEFDSTGSNPSVGIEALYDENTNLTDLTVVEVQNSSMNGSAGPLLTYRLGHSTNLTTITWQNSAGTVYEPVGGWNPKIAFWGPIVFEVHNGSTGAGPLWYRGGDVNATSISWEESHEYDGYGFNPSVTIDPFGYGYADSDNPVIEVHNGGAGIGLEWYHAGTGQWVLLQ